MEGLGVAAVMLKGKAIEDDTKLRIGHE
jgi:hypothetical protein